jgi:hypothetical protein
VGRCPGHLATDPEALGRRRGAVPGVGGGDAPVVRSRLDRVERCAHRHGADDTRSLSDFLSYVFPFDEPAWVLSVSFLDPLELDRWLPQLDDLAAGLQLSGTAR